MRHPRREVPVGRHDHGNGPGPAARHGGDVWHRVRDQRLDRHPACPAEAPSGASPPAGVRRRRARDPCPATRRPCPAQVRPHPRGLRPHDPGSRAADGGAPRPPRRHPSDRGLRRAAARPRGERNRGRHAPGGGGPSPRPGHPGAARRTHRRPPGHGGEPPRSEGRTRRRQAVGAGAGRARAEGRPAVRLPAGEVGRARSAPAREVAPATGPVGSRRTAPPQSRGGGPFARWPCTKASFSRTGSGRTNG